MERDELIGKILTIAGDYRKGEIATFDYKHVNRWVNQFQVNEQHKDVILLEVGHMLEKYYLSRDSAKANLLRIFQFMKEEKAGGCSMLDVNFLRTQEPGKSQHEILLMADEVLRDMHGVSTQECGGSKVYLYLDDCIFSGNKWRYDMRNSTQLDQAENGYILVSYHFMIYNEGFGYAYPHIKSQIDNKGGLVKPFRKELFNSQRLGNEPLDILWPTYINGNKQIDTFVNHSNESCDQKGWLRRPLFRTCQIASPDLFTSSTNQHIIEQSFLAVGAKLFCAAQFPAPSMRPMGFEVIATIGFGTPIITWRNIANNCPLAFWYGDPSYGPHHPLGIWYPLFPRKV